MSQPTPPVSTLVGFCVEVFGTGKVVRQGFESERITFVPYIPDKQFRAFNFATQSFFKTGQMKIATVPLRHSSSVPNMSADDIDMPVIAWFATFDTDT